MPKDMSVIRVKLTDFGLSKVTAKNTLTTLGVKPLLWTSIEGLKEDKFSRESDIW
jgi:serine/threonine protein kinase